MTQFWDACLDAAAWAEEFDPDNAGSLQLISDASASDGYAIELQSVGSSRVAWTLIDTGDVSDTEILAKIWGPAGSIINVVINASDNISAYRFSIAPHNSNQIRILQYAAGVYTVLSVDYNFAPLNNGGWNWVRARCDNDLLYLKAWADGDAEPDGWMLSAVAPVTVLGPGTVGLFAYDDAVRCDTIGIGTNGDVAPIADPGPGEPVNFNAALSVSGGGSASITARIGFHSELSSIGGGAAELSGRVGYLEALSVSGGGSASLTARIGYREVLSISGGGAAELTAAIGYFETLAVSGGGSATIYIEGDTAVIREVIRLTGDRNLNIQLAGDRRLVITLTGNIGD